MAEKPVFGYWNIRARGDPGRLLLRHLGVDFEDKRYGEAEHLPTWSEDKPNLGIQFPNLPYFKHEGVFHSESIPIMRSICRIFKPEYLGRNEVEAGRADALGQCLHDGLFKWASPYMFAEDYKTKMEEGKAKAAEWLQSFADAMGDNAFLAGNDGPTYADFQISFVVLVMEKYDAATVAANEKVAAWWTRFKALPNVTEALAIQEEERLFPGFCHWMKDNYPQYN